ncbi:MAG: efflux RND transporter periplasmic adaptor subunit [Flavisolibacter sp.]
MMKKIFFVGLMAALLSACRDKTTLVADAVTTVQNENEVVLTAAQYENAGIETGKLTLRRMATVLKLNGKVDVPPQNVVSISVPMGGYLKNTTLLPGAAVRKGQVLAVMEDPQYVQLQQEYLTSQAQLEYNRSEYNRQRDLNESKATSDKAFEQAKAAYQTQAILVRSLEQKIRLMGLNPERLTAGNISRSISVFAPISGYVSAVNVNVGKYVNPTDVLFEIINPSSIHLNLTAFEKDVNSLRKGHPILAYTNTDPTKKYRGEVLLVSRNLSADNAAQVHCHLENPDASLLPGYFMNAEIEVAGHDVMTVPEDAIVRYEGRQYVFTPIEKNRFEMVEVQTGSTENGYVELIHPEKWAGKTLVTKGAYSLLSALKNEMED